MDVIFIGRVSPEGCSAEFANSSNTPIIVGRLLDPERCPRWDDRRIHTFPKLSRPFLRLSRWNFPKNEAKVPVQHARKSCSLLGPKIPFPVNRPTFPLPDLGVTS
jgi:hypothetical protein